MFDRMKPAAGRLSYRGAPSNGRSSGLILLIALLSAGCASSQPPEPGAFYNAPSPIPSEPGRIVRVETLDAGVARANAYRILYSSRDRNDRPLVVSGMVLVPRTTTSERRPVVAWAHGTTGIAHRCAPSLEPKAAMKNLFGVQDLIDAGFLVVATDYPGLGATDGSHGYLIGDSEGHSVLDAVKAAVSSPDWQASSRYVIYGHSQGGHAALFATQMAPEYAPDLDLLGTVVLAPATNLGAILRQDMDTPVGKVFGAMALKSWSRLYQGAALPGIVRAQDVPLVDDIAANCIETTQEGLADLPAITLMGDNWLVSDPTTTEPWADIIRDNSVRPSGITVPLFVGQGTSDEVIPPSVTTNWVREMCASDPDVDYQEYDGKSHVGVGAAAEPGVIDWIEARFAGQPAPSDCDELR